jgi:hypothetical protein
MTCSQWQSWAAFHAIKRLEFEWDKYPETYANWPRSKMDKTEAGVGNVEKMVSKREAERAAGAVWAKGTGETSVIGRSEQTVGACRRRSRGLGKRWMS